MGQGEWDSNFSYDPQANAQKKPVLRQINNVPKSERLLFRENERRRLQDLEKESDISPEKSFDESKTILRKPTREMPAKSPRMLRRIVEAESAYDRFVREEIEKLG